MPASITIDQDPSPIALKDQCVIGRKRTVDVVLDDQRVSREHAMIRREGGHYSLFDLDSANGTALNGAPVSRPIRLRDGDCIQIGGSSIVFRSGQPATASMTTFSDATMIGFEKQPMLFLVADVKGYTRLSGKLSDTELTEVMREWYAACEETMGEGGAIIDKFIGDSVFAYWMSIGSDARASAVDSANRLMARTHELSDRHARLLLPHGARLECCVGLHCGLANLGAMVRGQTTALGDAVNLTFRLESLTRLVGNPLLLSKEFVDGWQEGETRCVSRGSHSLKGIEAPVEVFVLREE